MNIWNAAEEKPEHFFVASVQRQIRLHSGGGEIRLTAAVERREKMLPVYHPAATALDG